MLAVESRIGTLLLVPCLFVHIQLSEDFGSVEKMCIFNDPACWLAIARTANIAGVLTS